VSERPVRPKSTRAIADSKSAEEDTETRAGLHVVEVSLQAA
jgi:hypothetical protein